MTGVTLFLATIPYLVIGYSLLLYGALTAIGVKSVFSCIKEISIKVNEFIQPLAGFVALIFSPIIAAIVSTVVVTSLFAGLPVFALALAITSTLAVLAGFIFLSFYVVKAIYRIFE